MADVDTGMPKPDMKRLLAKSKMEPVNCAFGLGSDPSLGLLLLDRVKQPKAVDRDLSKAFPDAKNTRFGTAFVDVDDNPKLVKFIINKPVSGMARKLVKTLKGTGFSRVEILLEDGSPVEGYSEDEEAASGAEAHRPEAQPAPQAVPDLAALQRALAALIQGVATVADPARKAAFVKLAGDINGQLKAGDLAGAATGVARLRAGLAAPAASATVEPAPTGTSASAPMAPGAATYIKSGQAWIATRNKVEAEIEKLRAEIVAAYQAEGIATEIDKAYTARVAPVLATLDDSLTAKLGEAAGATDPAARGRLVEEARAIIGRYQAYLAGEPLIADLDANPFAPLMIQKTVSATLAALANAVH